MNQIHQVVQYLESICRFQTSAEQMVVGRDFTDDFTRMQLITQRADQDVLGYGYNMISNGNMTSQNPEMEFDQEKKYVLFQKDLVKGLATLCDGDHRDLRQHCFTHMKLVPLAPHPSLGS